MPLIVALAVSLGSFFGYAGGDKLGDKIARDNQVQQHWLMLKHTNIETIAGETLWK